MLCFVNGVLFGVCFLFFFSFGRFFFSSSFIENKLAN